MFKKYEIQSHLLNLSEIRGIVETSLSHMPKEKIELLLGTLFKATRNFLEYNGTLYYYYELGKRAEREGRELVERGEEL